MTTQRDLRCISDRFPRDAALLAGLVWLCLLVVTFLPGGRAFAATACPDYTGPGPAEYTINPVYDYPEFYGSCVPRAEQEWTAGHTKFVLGVRDNDAFAYLQEAWTNDYAEPTIVSGSGCTIGGHDIFITPGSSCNVSFKFKGIFFDPDTYPDYITLTANISLAPGSPKPVPTITGIFISDGIYEGSFPEGSPFGTLTPPEMSVSSSIGGAVIDGGRNPHGDHAAGTPVTATFTVTNAGQAVLNVDQATSSNASNVTIGSIGAPASSVIAGGGGTSTFEVSYTPTAAGPYAFDLSFTSNDTNQTPFSFTVSGTGLVTAPTVTAVSPNSGTAVGGTAVTISGTAFTGATKVAFGTTEVPAADFTSTSDTQIVVPAPPSAAGTVNVSVTTPDGTSADNGVNDDFTYVAADQTITFTSVPPATAAVGGTAYIVAATASSNLPVAFSIAPASAAVCTVAGSTVNFTGEGTCTILADQAGNATYDAAPQVQQVVNVANTAAEAAKAIGGFVSDRANMIVSNQFDASGQIDRLNQAQGQGNGQQNGSTGFAAPQAQPLAALSASQPSRVGASPALGANSASGSAQDMFGLQAFLHDYLSTAGQSREFRQFRFSGPFEAKASFANGTNGSFKASLSQLNTWQQQQEAALGYGGSTAGSSYSPFDLWVEGAYASYDGEREGHFGMVSVGADYVFSPNFLAGFYGQFDTMEQTSGTDLEGKGWMVGPYATARLGQNVFWQGRAGWGQSDNDIVATATGSFDSTRWLVSSSLTGRWQMENGFAFAPTASFTYFKDDAESYVDSLGATIPSVSTELGQIKLSPALSYAMTTNDGLRIEPSLAAELLWNFASTNASGLGDLGSDTTGPKGLRGRIKAGLGLKTQSGVSLEGSGSYDGLGSSGYKSLAGQARVTLPLN